MLEHLIWRMVRGSKLIFPDFDIKQLCIENGISMFPELVTEILDIMAEVNEYIDTKAKKDLPHQQYKSDIAKLNYDQLTEVGGLIEYRGGVKELLYFPHNQEINLKYKFPIEIQVKIVLNQALEIEVIEDSPYPLVDWHSHPGKHGVSILDVLSLSKEATQMKEGNVDFYAVLHNPLINTFQWYQFKDIS